MSRLIDADALLRRAKKVATEAWKMKLKAPIEITLNQFIDWINEAPTAAVEPHWIPVEQALPEKDGRYYVTLENKYVEILYYAVEQTIRHPKGFYYLSEDGRMTWRQTQNPVIAWMPLPESFVGVTE